VFIDRSPRSVSGCAQIKSRAKVPVCLLLAFLLVSAIKKPNKCDTLQDRPSSLVWKAQAHYVMGTILEIVLAAENDLGDQAFASLFAIARRHDEIFSTFKPESPVSRFNRFGSNRVAFAVPAEMIELAAISQQLADQTQGAFDITVGPLVKLWQEAVRRKRWPRADEIQAARQRVGAHRIEINFSARTIAALAEGVELDFNGIAKGYCVDKMVDALREAGINHALINFGESSIYALGKDPSGSLWSVEVRDPRRPTETALRLRLSQMAIGSSASYEHLSKLNGRPINHIVDPRTGMPANSHTAVTVVAASATIADALSTALVVLSPDEGLRVLKNFPGAEAVIFYRSSKGRWQMVFSQGMHRFIEQAN
jgi:thiamine biosynthesis lipoprotein